MTKGEEVQTSDDFHPASVADIMARDWDQRTVQAIIGRMRWVGYDNAADEIEFCFVPRADEPPSDDNAS